MNPTESAWFDETLRIRCPDGAPPTRLFKFLPPDSKYFALALHELFLHNRVRLSSRTDFNDPFDTQFGLNLPEMDADLMRCVEKMVNRTQAEESTAHPSLDLDTIRADFHRKASKVLDHIGIYSLAESARHPLMWAHYANSHRGIALVLRHGTAGSFGAFPIRYEETYPCGDITEDGLPLHLCFVKGRAWEYEKEWRIALPNAAHTMHTLSPYSLCGVVFGARATTETFDVVKDLIKRRAQAGLPPICVYRAEAANSFELQFYQFVGSADWAPTQLD